MDRHVAFWEGALDQLEDLLDRQQQNIPEG
jgi:hypothetical protein